MSMFLHQFQELGDSSLSLSKHQIRCLQNFFEGIDSARTSMFVKEPGDNFDTDWSNNNLPKYCKLTMAAQKAEGQAKEARLAEEARRAEEARLAEEAGEARLAEEARLAQEARTCRGGKKSRKRQG